MGLLGFVVAAALPPLLWHRAIAAVAEDFRFELEYLSGWTGYALIAAGLAFFVPVVVSIGRAARKPPLPARPQRLRGVGHLAVPAGLRDRRPGGRRRTQHHADPVAPIAWRAMSRFSEPQDPLFQALNSSISFDFRLAPYDIAQSLAHARMLAHSEIIGAEDLAEIERGLAQVRAEVDEDRFEVKPDDEDVHMAIERRLTEIVGRRRRAAAHRPLAQRPGGHRRGDARARPQPHRPRSCCRR